MDLFREKKLGHITDITWAEKDLSVWKGLSYMYVMSCMTDGNQHNIY